jgi:[ribosomal protein S5]-alanine N-acetyltransferase
MNAPERFETERLILRKPRVEYASLIFSAYGRDPAVTRFLTWRPHETLADADAGIKFLLSGWESGTEYSWTLFLRDSDQLVGCISARVENCGINLGYVLGRMYWGQGLMVEAVTRVTEWAFTEPSIHRVWALCDTENGASARVLEKAGFEREGILRRFGIHPNVSAIPRDCYSYAIVRDGESNYG